MMSIFSTIWGWITWVFSGLMPFTRREVLSPIVRWVVWILLDVAFLGLLYFLNYYFRLDGSVRLPTFLRDHPRLGEWWLPILGQLLVFMAIVLYWFYLLWFADADESDFPDIDQAWDECMRALAQAGIQLPKLPLFLVIGRPESSEDHLFEASGLKLVVKQTPAYPNAPVHVYADRDGVYVTCRGASVLGKLSGILSLEDMPEGASALDADATEDLDKTLKPGGKEQGIIEMLRASMGQETNSLRKRAMRRAALGKALGNDFMSDSREVARHKARLAHLCRLIVRDRQPFCAANGIMLLVPIAGTDTPLEAQLTAQACQEDLHVARHEMKLDCPVVSLIVDMESMPGFPEFMARQPPKELGNRRGNGFPMATRLSRNETLDEIRRSLHWVCTTYLQDSVYRIFQSETPTFREALAFFPENSHLFQLLDEMNQRADSLSTIVLEAVGPENDSLYRYAGCYLAATGPKGNQAFVAGVFQKMVKEQSCVGWTEAALAEDSQSRTWANYYLMLSGVMFILLLALGAWFFLRAWLIKIADAIRCGRVVRDRGCCRNRRRCRRPYPRGRRFGSGCRGRR
jgi:hypothetical protein